MAVSLTKERNCKGIVINLCPHDACTTGIALHPTCTNDGQNGICISAICADVVNKHCCTVKWDLDCTDLVLNKKYGCTNACALKF